jgi:hypothetical protein
MTTASGFAMKELARMTYLSDCTIDNDTINNYNTTPIIANKNEATIFLTKFRGNLLAF